jgi:hypothetical protein
MPDLTDYEPQNRYPVVVEETRRYVVWLEADKPDEAVESFSDDPGDPGHDAMFWFTWEARTPDDLDWYHIQHGGDGGWPGTRAEAHVQAYRYRLAYLERQEERERCAAAGHPIPEGATGPLAWADYCGTCGDIDPASRAAVA